jgi:hypothetical protein
VERLQSKSGNGPQNEVVGPDQAVYVPRRIAVVPRRTSSKLPEKRAGSVFDCKKADAVGGGADEWWTVSHPIVGAFERGWMRA